jgi:hypothetical protein
MPTPTPAKAATITLTAALAVPASDVNTSALAAAVQAELSSTLSGTAVSVTATATPIAAGRRRLHQGSCTVVITIVAAVGEGQVAAAISASVHTAAKAIVADTAALEAILKKALPSKYWSQLSSIIAALRSSLTVVVGGQPVLAPSSPSPGGKPKKHAGAAGHLLGAMPHAFGYSTSPDVPEQPPKAGTSAADFNQDPKKVHQAMGASPRLKKATTAYQGPLSDLAAASPSTGRRLRQGGSSPSNSSGGAMAPINGTYSFDGVDRYNLVFTVAPGEDPSVVAKATQYMLTVGQTLDAGVDMVLDVSI